MRRLLQGCSMLGAVGALLCGVAHAQPIPQPPELKSLMEAGDPQAVPLILARLREAAARPMRDDANRFYMMGTIEQARRYRLEEAGPLMVALYQRSGVTESELNFLAYSAAEYRTEAALGLQKALLADARLTNPEPRVALLATVAGSGDPEAADRAADALADWTLARIEEMEPNKAVAYSFMEAIPSVRSRRYAERIAAIALPPPPATAAAAQRNSHDQKRRFVSRLQTKLAIANSQPEAIIASIAKAGAGDEALVDVALITLADIAEPRHIEALAAVPLGKDGVLASNGRLQSRRRNTIAAIKRHHWRHFAELAATQPAGDATR